MKSQPETDSEILSSAKVADVVTSESSSEIRVRHTRSVHPQGCQCLIHRGIKLRENPDEELEAKENLDWWRP